MISRSWIVLVVAWVAATPVRADSSASVKYRIRADVEADPGGGGVVVHAVAEDGPGMKMKHFGWRPQGEGRLQLVLADYFALEKGDVIESVNGRPVRTVEQCQAAVDEAGRTVGAAILAVRDATTRKVNRFLINPAPDRPIPGVTGGPGLPPLADPEAAPAFQPVNPARQSVYRLLTDLTDTENRVTVASCHPDGPGAKMKIFGWQSINEGKRLELVVTNVGRLEAGDVIESVNGRRVRTVKECQDVVDEAGRTIGAAILAVRDKNTGRVVSWVVHPAPAKVVPGDKPPRRNVRVKILILADDDDRDLGWGFRQNAAAMVELWSGVPGVGPEDILILTTSGKSVGRVKPARPGDEAPEPKTRSTRLVPEEIQEAISDLHVGRNDALVCCVLAHGAYKSKADSTDPSEGHLFQKTTGGRVILERQRLRRELRAANAALTVLLSDSCNQKYIPPVTHEYMMGSVPTPFLDHLLRDYRGVVDVNACSRNESAWYQLKGAHFTRALVAANDATRAEPSWDGYLARVKQATNMEFTLMRKALLSDPKANPDNKELLKKQTTQVPAIFENTVVRTGDSFRAATSKAGEPPALEMTAPAAAP